MAGADLGDVDVAVPAAVTDRLRGLARQHDATLFTIAAAAYAVLLQRYCGQDEMLIGASVTGSTLPLRIRLDGDPTFTELLAGTRGTILDAQAHPDLPPEALGPTAVRALVRWAGAGERPAAGRWHLTLTLAEAEDGMRGALRYSTELFDHTTIERLAGHLGILLESVALDPDRPVSRLRLLSEAEQRWLRESQSAVAELPAVDGIHELFAARARTCPDTVAVRFGEDSLTYAELDRRANRLAHRLRGLGVGPDTVVGFCLPRGIDVVVSILAIWKAGGAYLPLDLNDPAGRRRRMLAQSRARLLITDRATAATAADPGGDVATLMLDDPAIAAQPPTAPAVRVHPEQAAYVIYTSGSTGQPKGVVNTHRGLLNLTTTLQPQAGTHPGRTALQFAAFTFDAAVFDVAVSLTAGATLAIATPAERADPAELARLLHRLDVRSVSIVPSLLAALRPGDLPAGATVIVGAEALPANLAQAWASQYTLRNCYGPTEASVMTTFSTIGAGTARPPIGRPLPNTRTHLLDRYLNLVPVGVAGEVFIGGVGVARGYTGQPARTAERFVPDPFAGDGSRLYRTGDLARRLSDGQLDFLGRVDHQIKVRGHRVEPAEIERALTDHPRVAAAVVTAHGDTDARRLVAYLVPAGGDLPAADQLREHLRAALPEHMIPAVFVELANLPLNRNGKLDRAALPAAAAVRPVLSGDYRAPTTPTEVALAGIWAEVLGVDRVGTTDDFLDLGGQSFLAIRVITRIRTVLGADLPIAALFEHATVGALAKAVTQVVIGGGADVEEYEEFEF
ncbi:non-ribosomal peptide synthetase [Dactylosporangium darangshiense]|uniref:Carrier domain-containing protein n=1 Tax=Dactylosporangium darangshiense TaxID=579108 RepID=A0ABP8DTA9_9ACTN